MSGTVLTNKGLALITKLVAASTELQISRVAVGTGRVPSGVDPQTMVDLNEYKMDAQIESYGVSPDQSDVAYIAAQVSSIGVSAGFAVTEAGVFATDPDVGEILYAYLDLTEDPQYIYAETDAISKFAEITFNVLIGSVAKVTAYVSPGALTKKVDFNAFKESVETPEFDDSGTVEGISSFPSFLETMKSKMNFFQFFRNLKAGLQFVLHAGQIVNNCVTDNAGLPLSAAQGKALMDKYTQLYSDMSNYRVIIVNDTPADDIPSLLKAKAKLISNQNKGQGFYVIIGGWQGKTYGFSIGNVIGGKITIACFLNNNCYLATCDYSNPENNFSYATMKPDLSPYITKSQLFAAQSQSFLVNKSTTIDGTLFSTANFKAQRPNTGTGAASYGFENIGINSGALYLDPTDYKLHFINYEGNDFTINWTKN